MALFVLMVNPGLCLAKDNRSIPVVNFMFMAETIAKHHLQNFSKQYYTKIFPVYYTNAHLMMLRVHQSQANGQSIDVLMSQVYNQNVLEDNHTLTSLDHELLPNLENISPKLRNLLPGDPNNMYMIPMFGGTMSLVVNSRLIDPASIRSYMDLWNIELSGRLLIPEDFHSLLPVALQAMGRDARHIRDNVSDLDMEQAWSLIRLLGERSSQITNNAIDYLGADSDIAAALVYSCDVYSALEKNRDLKVITPREGNIGWIEAISIPSQTSNRGLAHAWVNYMLEPEVAAAVAGETGYIPLNDKAYEIMAQNRRSASLPTLQEFLKMPRLIDHRARCEYYNRMWQQFVSLKYAYY